MTERLYKFGYHDFMYMSYRSYTCERSYNFVNNFDEVITSLDKTDEVVTSSEKIDEVITSSYKCDEVITSTKKSCRSYFRSTKYQITNDI
jgi:hypothetical protein